MRASSAIWRIDRRTLSKSARSSVPSEEKQSVDVERKRKREGSLSFIFWRMVLDAPSMSW